MPASPTSAHLLVKPEMIDSVEEITSSIRSNPFHIQRLREKFLDKALKDLTVGPNTLASSFSSSSTNNFNLTTGGVGGTGKGYGGEEERGMLMDPTNPLLVEAELKAQKAYFKLLKFKYLEQESKLEFLGSITGEQPKVLSLGENEERERTNAQKKADLKRTKDAIDSIKAETVGLSRVVGDAHAKLLRDAEEAARMDKMVKEAELELARIRAQYPLNDRMTTSQATTTLDAQIEEMQTLDAVLQSTNATLDNTREQVSRVAKEVQRLGRDRDREEARAKEARAEREGRENGEDTVGELCRWYTSAIDLYKQMLGIRSIKAVSNSELHLEYTVPATSKAILSRRKSAEGESVTLALHFDEESKRLIAAELLNHDADIAESVLIASQSNDVPGLVADVLTRIRNPKTV